MSDDRLTPSRIQVVTSPAPQLPGPWVLSIDWTSGADPFDRDWDLLRAGPHSRIFRSQGPQPWIIKLIKPRSTPRDQIRKYNNAQARREFIGSRYLSRIGLTVPATYGWGVALSPFSRFESVLFMAPLDHFISGLAVIRTEHRHETRRRFLTRLATDIATIHGNHYIHKDCHFDNLCWLNDGRIAWVDNDVRKARNVKALTRGFRKTRDLLHRTAGANIPIEEWRFFMQQTDERLKNHPNGGPLRRELQ